MNNAARWKAQEDRDRLDEFQSRGRHAFPDDYSDMLSGDSDPVPIAGTTEREAWDQKNAAIFFAWREWETRLRDWSDRLESEKCRRPSARSVTENKRKFAELMQRRYGRPQPHGKWIEEHQRWNGE